MTVLQAVLWDFGGVLTTSPFEAFARYEAQHGLPTDFIRGINASNPDSNAWARFERSEVDAEAFDGLFLAESTAAGHPVPGRDVIALLSGDLRPRMIEALDRIRARYRTACITNNVRGGTGAGMARTDTQAQSVAAVMERFEMVIESSVLGLRKPDPRIYTHTCSELGVDPTACLFIDDLGVNLKPARQLGMRTIKVLSEEQALAELAEATGLDLT